LPDDFNNEETRQVLETQIYNLLGQLVYREKYSETISIGLLKEGLYLITVVNPGNKKSYSQKLLIDRRF